LVEIGVEEERASLRGTVCEVQVTTLAAHVFNELEHDIRYKTHGIEIGELEEETLVDLKGAARLLDRSAERLLIEHGQTIIRTKRQLKEASELQFVFEQSVGHKLHGDFERLFRFFRSSVQPFTAASLDAFGTPADLLAQGGQLAEKAKWLDADDVAKIVMAMYETHVTELEAFVRGRGRPGSFKYAVEAARNLRSQEP
jgi:hypothetical protein